MTENSKFLGPLVPEVTTFRVVAPAGVNCGFGTKLFVLGQEIPNIEKLEYSTRASANDITTSTITLTIFEPIAVDTAEGA